MTVLLLKHQRRHRSLANPPSLVRCHVTAAPPAHDGSCHVTSDVITDAVTSPGTVRLGAGLTTDDTDWNHHHRQHQHQHDDVNQQQDLCRSLWRHFTARCSAS